MIIFIFSICFFWKRVPSVSGRKIVGGSFWGNDRMTYLFFELLAGFACYLSAFVCYVCTLTIAFGIAGFRYFSGGYFGKDIKGKFHVCHIVTEGFFVKTFITFVLIGCLTTPFLCNDVSKRGILLSFFHSGSIPLALPSSDATRDSSSSKACLTLLSLLLRFVSECFADFD